MAHEHKTFLVTGHARCGTGYMASLFGCFGYDLGHELVGSDGISSWLMVPREGKVGFGPSRPRSDFTFDHVIGVIRHPVDALSSIAFTEMNKAGSVRYRRRFLVALRRVSGSDIHDAVMSYVLWYAMLEEQNPELIVKVEEAPARIKEFLEDKGMQASTPDRWPSTSTNGRTHEWLRPAQLEEEAGGWFAEVQRIAALYEYDLEKDGRSAQHHFEQVDVDEDLARLESLGKEGGRPWQTRLDGKPHGDVT